MQNTYWVRKEIKTRFSETSTDHLVEDNIQADSHEQAIKRAFDADVIETGYPANLGICTQASNENGHRHWRIVEK